MALRFLYLVDPIVGHAIFRDRFDQAEVSLRTAHRAAESLGPVIDIVQSRELQSGIASADIAAEPHLSVGLGECAKGEGTMRPRSNHTARLEPVGGQQRINFLQSVLAQSHHCHRQPTVAPSQVIAIVAKASHSCLQVGSGCV
jgi:hypothetical protein